MTQIKKTGRYNCFIVSESEKSGDFWWTIYLGSNYKEALTAFGKIRTNNKDTKLAYIQGISLDVNELDLVGEELDEAITNASCNDRKSNYILTKGEW